MKTNTLTTEQLAQLQRLEQAIYDAGIDGGMFASEAIQDLHDEEKRLGVYDPHNTKHPRWVKP